MDELQNESAKAESGREDKAPEDEYGDLLLVDLLRPDWKHFFTRYRVDFWGFVIISGIVAFIIFGTRWLTMIGAGG